MKESTRNLINNLNALHDFSDGQVYSGGGTEYHSTDTCRVCGLRRHWRDDVQNNVHNEYRFSDGETGQDLSLRQVIARGCM